MIRRAVFDDLTYIVSLARRECEAIGFIPSSRYESILTGIGDSRPNHRLWIAEENGDRVGFLYASPGKAGGALKVLQVCVQDDARRLEFGSVLVQEAESYASSIQRSGVSLAVATDLEASQFWEAGQYRLVRIEPGGTSRGRFLERRYKSLACGLWLPERLT